jgi:activator of 2-hydroxyglutaryl-CoA dehydratase
VVDALQRNLRGNLKTFPDGVDPQMMGGIGAAVIAREKYIKQNG